LKDGPASELLQFEFLKDTSTFKMADAMVLEEEITSALGDDILRATADEINSRCRLLDNEIKAMKNDSSRLTHEQANIKDRVKENEEKIKLNKQLPYLVGNIVEVVQPDLRSPFLTLPNSPVCTWCNSHPATCGAVGSQTVARHASSSEAVRAITCCKRRNRGSC